MSSPLLRPAFRNLFLARVIALFGTGLTGVALALLAFDMAEESAGSLLGKVFALKMIIYVVVAPIVGSWATRLPRRGFLIAMDLARVGITLCLPFADATWQVFGLMGLLYACSAAFTPVYQATLPDILPDGEEYTRALSLSRLAADLEQLLSPALAAGALVVLRYNALFVGNAVAFAISAVFVAASALPAVAARHERARGFLANTTYGIRAYLATPRLRALLLLFLPVSLGGAMVIVNTVVYVQSNLGLSESHTALAIAAAGGGSMLAALSLPALLRRYPQRRVMLTAALGISLGTLTIFFEPGFAGLLPGWLAVGIGWSLIETPAGRLLRDSCEPADRPALFAAHFALTHLCWLVAYPLAGELGSRVGLPLTSAILAGLALAATAWAARCPMDGGQERPAGPATQP